MMQYENEVLTYYSDEELQTMNCITIYNKRHKLLAIINQISAVNYPTVIQ